jgi:hypothetical protein
MAARRANRTERAGRAAWPTLADPTTACHCAATHKESAMRRTILIALAAAALAASGCAAHSPASQTAAPAAAPAGATAAHQHPEAATTGDDARRAALVEAANLFPLTAARDSRTLAGQLARARLATARYATDLRVAKSDGYQIITRDIPDMGWHYLNPKVQGFDVTRPHILVYERHGRTWQLAALEWVFTTTPARPPLPGAAYGSFGAACHYTDGTFVFRAVQKQCPGSSPQTGAPFNFWHPDLVTLHVWLWYPNPDGLYNGTNPYVRPFNRT